MQSDNVDQPFFTTLNTIGRGVFRLVAVLALITGVASGVPASETKSRETESVKRYAFGIGPTGGVQEKTENDLHNQALDHWEEVNRNKCPGVKPRNCDAIPNKVQDYYSSNPGDEPARGVEAIRLEKFIEPAKATDEGTGFSAGDIETPDIDNDGQKELALSGYTTPSYAAKIVLFDQIDSKSFFEKMSTNPKPLPSGYLTNGDMEFADVDGENGVDLIAQGVGPSSADTVAVYENNGNGNLSFLTGISPLVAEFGPALEVGDLDGDGDPDVVVSGNDGTSTPRLIVFHNDGSGTFSMIQEPMTGDGGGIALSMMELGNLNADTLPDLVVAGDDESNKRLIVYKNSGSGTFVKTDEPLGANSGIYSGDLALADVTGNGRKDILTAGPGAPISENDDRFFIFENQSISNFTEVTGVFDTEPLYFAGPKLAVADFGGDGDKDFTIQGRYVGSTGYYDDVFRTLTFMNDDGPGASFTQQEQPFVESGDDTGLQGGAIHAADIDGDGDNDPIYSGDQESDGTFGGGGIFKTRTIIYENKAP
ncbi:MAG: FG-GAP repeat domain-containing protein [bacterium]